MIVRRLGRGDADVVARLATQARPARVDELLGDERTVFLVAFDGDAPIGFALAYELIRRHGAASQLFLYEVEVEPAQRRRGVATALLGELARFARERGIRNGFVLASADNDAAMRLYASVGATGPREEVLWEFEYG